MKKLDRQRTLRLPQDLDARLKASGEASGRSLNAEIVFRLRESFQGGVAGQARDGEPDVVSLRDLESAPDLRAVVREEVERQLEKAGGEAIDQRIRRILRDMINDSGRHTG